MTPVRRLPRFGLPFLLLLSLTCLCNVLCVQGTKCRCNIQPAVALGLPEPNCFMNDYTCTSDKGCYLRRYYLQERGMIVQVWDCITDQYNVESQIDHVKIFCGYWNTPTDAYKCCNSTDLCNERLQITLPMETMSPTPSPAVSTSISPSSTVLHHSHMTHSGSHSSHSVNIKLVVAITVPVTVILLAISGLLVSVVYVCVVVQKRRTQHLQFPTTSPAHTHWTHDLELAKQSVGQSSPDLPYQVLTDIKDIVKLNYQIERGRFGVFYHGYYEEEEIVLKRFEERDRSAWLRESLMYNSILQSHENVLAFFASAMTNSDDSSPEYWLATKYHEFGSLQDYLRQHTVEAEVILQMTASICSGLAHLHSDRSYNQAKISVAHCNLTSRNILVKDNLSCCIGDFRLAVFKYKNEVNLPDNAAPGTIRYMAPELLSEPVSHLLSFETFKQADVYALGLVLWKICQRGSCYGEAYQVPFQGLIPPEPSLEDMRRLVVVERAQPTIPSKWNYNKLFHEMTKVMQECWYYTGTARPTAVYLKKKLLKMSHEFEKTEFTIEETALPSKGPCNDTQYGKVFVSTL